MEKVIGLIIIVVSLFYLHGLRKISARFVIVALMAIAFITSDLLLILIDLWPVLALYILYLILIKLMRCYKIKGEKNKNG